MQCATFHSLMFLLNEVQYIHFSDTDDNGTSETQFLMLTLGGVCSVVLILITVLMFILYGRDQQGSNKFSVLDNQGTVKLQHWYHPMISYSRSLTRVCAM